MTVGRGFGAALGLALCVGCARARPTPEPESGDLQAAVRADRAACVQEVMRSYPRLAYTPTKPEEPTRTRAQAPQEWADYTRELRRYGQELTEYNNLRTMAEHRIALQCYRPVRSTR
jgi:hypothetical protein